MDMFAVSEAGQTEDESPAKTIDNIDKEYHLVDDATSRSRLLNLLSTQSEVCFDTETTGLDPLAAHMVGMSFAFKKGQAFYVPVSVDIAEAKTITDQFKTFFENRKIKLIGQNLNLPLHTFSFYLEL